MWVGIGIGALSIGVLCPTWGIGIEFRQQRADGPVALVATYPFAIQAALLFAVGLLAIRRALSTVLPWWVCLGIGVCMAFIGIATITIAGRIGRTRRLSNKPLQRT